MIGADKVVTAVTLDQKNREFQAHEYDRASWHRVQKNLFNGGMITKADEVSCRIMRQPGADEIKKGTVIFLGSVPIEEKSADTMGDLKEKYPEHFTVESVSVNYLGTPGTQHVHLKGA